MNTRSNLSLLLVSFAVVGCATANEGDHPAVIVDPDSGKISVDPAPAKDSGAETDNAIVDSAVADTAVADTAECVAGKTETRGCGMCGAQSRFCLGGGVWSSWTDCTGELAGAECSIGDKRTTDCGNCGKETDFCDAKTCTWVTGFCAGEGPCAPGDSETSAASCGTAGEIRTRTCDDKCQWSDYSGCDLPRGWVAMEPAPISGRAFHTAVWTGTDMIVWGGGYSSTLKNDGASYNLASNKWKTIATPSLSARRQHVSVWTGTKLIVWGGYDGASPLKDGAVYDPSTDSWTAMATSPLTARHAAAAAWSTTTNELLVWGGCTSGWCNTSAADGAAYDPATNSWHALPASPLSARSDAAFAWTGKELVVWGGRSSGTTFLTDGARFDPLARTWTKFSDPTSTVLDGRIDEGFGVDAGTLFVWGGRAATSGSTTAKSNGATYVAGVGFTAIPTAPDSVLSPSARRYDVTAWMAKGKLFVFGGIPSTASDTSTAGGATYDFATDTWTALDATGAPGARDRASVVWTGREAIVWGGLNGNTCCTTYANGAIHRP